MSLYEGLGVETAPLASVMGAEVEKEDKSGLSGWTSASTSGMKLMAPQMQRTKKSTMKPGPQRSRSSNVVLGVSKAQPQQRGQMVASLPAPEPEPMEEDDLGVELEDEYNPLKPNIYEEYLIKKRKEEAAAKAEDRKAKMNSSEKKSLTALSNYSDSDSEDEEERRKEERRKESAAMFAPPSSLIEADMKAVEKAAESTPDFAPPAAPKFASAVASNIMAKYGWKAGQGLGKSEQGMVTALSVKKTSLRGGKIINQAAEATTELPMEAPPPPVQTKVPLSLEKPTKVVLLKNMVGQGEVDDDLQPEVQAECSKFGEVSKCLIFEIPHGVSDDEAVRIFIEFSKVDTAIKAAISLNGRFFGGRVVKAEFYSEERFRKFDLGP